MKDNSINSECTTIIAGRKMTADGSFILARSSDFDAMIAVNYTIYKSKKKGPSEFKAKDSGFRCPLPRERMGYSALPDYQYPGEWGSAGFNDAGVGMSSTETIFSSDKALSADPYVIDGLAENCTFDIILPYIHSAREGVEMLGAMIEKYGSAEGFGIGFIDDSEIWYLENACGHRWLACRMPEDRYFATGNQSRLREYDPKDRKNFLAAADLVEFAAANGLYDAGKGAFDFHEAYSRESENDTTYNYPRVWGLQKMFSPGIRNDVARNNFPVYARADKPMSISDFRKAFRFHYDGTDHDPYLHCNGKEPYRPVAIYRTTQTHLLQIRPELPKEIGRINYVAMGMADLGVFLPLYQGVKSYPKAYGRGKGVSDNDSAYWKFRKVMTLGMVNYNAYAPIIKAAYSDLEASNDLRQKEMEKKYLQLCKKNPEEAGKLLQKFSDSVLLNALDVADGLINELFTHLAKDIQKEYYFHGA